METTTPMSFRNRTGVQMSPSGAAQLKLALEVEPPPQGDASAVAELREAYVADAEAIGSIPAPGTLKGLATAGLQALTGRRAQVLLDKLGERLAFERTGVRLYEALIAKCEALAAAPRAAEMLPPLDQLRRIRDEEAQHFEMVVEAIGTLGGDATAETPSADLVGIECAGLLQVVADPRTTLSQSLHAVLGAELSDNAAWELLLLIVQLCRLTGLEQKFQLALAQEDTHLRLVGQWHSEATLKELRLGAV